MNILYLVLRIVKTIHLLNIRVFHPRGISSPIRSIRDYQHWSWCAQRRYLYVVGLVHFVLVYRHPTFAHTAAKKMGGNLNRGYGNFYPIVNCGKYKGLGATTRTAGYPNTLWVHIGAR